MPPSRGKVAVRDFRRRKSMLLRAGKSYLSARSAVAPARGTGGAELCRLSDGLGRASRRPNCLTAGSRTARGEATRQKRAVVAARHTEQELERLEVDAGSPASC